jgi:hypothetical protein
MTHLPKAVVVALGILVATLQPSAAQTGAAVQLTPEAMEQFLKTAKIVATRGTSKGVTNPKRVTLSDGQLTHDAQIQDVDIAMPIFDVGPKHTEINFRDTYRYNIAAYRLSLLLGLDNVPMSVERTWNGKPAAITWWLDDVAMDEGQRQKQKGPTVNPQLIASYLRVMRVFDELLQNRDRNAGNMLWTKEGRLWMIDHTRAFRLGKNLLKPEDLDRCERSLLERLKALTPDQVSGVMGGILKKDELEALFARRDLIVKHFDQRMAERGAEVVLFTMPVGTN